MDKKERTKRLIIEKAAPIFNQKGYFGTSMSDLTKAIGLTKGAIYGNFKNKDEIAIAIFDHSIQAILKELNLSIEKKVGAIDKLLVIPEFFKTIFFKNLKHGGCPIVNTAVDSNHVHTTLNKRVASVLGQLRALMVDIIDKGRVASEIRADISSDEYASVFITLIEGSVMLSSSTSDMKYIDHSFRFMKKIVVEELALLPQVD
jgi:AcrR family transcriptional regulator